MKANGQTEITSKIMQPTTNSNYTISLPLTLVVSASNFAQMVLKS